MPDSDAGKTSSFNEQLVVMYDARLFVELLRQQLTVVGGPVEHIIRLVVGETRHVDEVAGRRVVAHDERVGTVQRRRHHDPAAAGTTQGGSATARTTEAGTAVAVAGGRVKQSVVGVVDDERSNVNAADDEPSPRRLIHAAVHLKF